MDNPKIKRALVSVTDKTGLVEFAKALVDQFGVEIISTGGTAKTLTDAGVAVTPIEQVTSFPEMMGGRVKTLHPKVHGGILARRDNEQDMADAKDNGVDMIDMVVVNLYEFEKTIAQPDVTFEDAIDHIDIGGPSMLRSAAKNHKFVTVVPNPQDYDFVINEMQENDGAVTADTRRALALEAFGVTSAYDNAIYNWLDSQTYGNTSFAYDKRIFMDKKAGLRYGENPHQRAAFYLAGASKSDTANTIAGAKQLQGKELSYNNYLDIDAAWAAVREYDEPTCVIVKHLSPCGIASDDFLLTAYMNAWSCDPVSAYGGVIAFNRVVTPEVVTMIFKNKQFVECIVAPGFADEVLQLYEEKPNARLLATGGINKPGQGLELRSVEGGVLVQERDSVSEDPATFTVPTKRKPTDEEMTDLLFAWKGVKSVKSNAILLAKGKMSVGIGGGQPNRVNSARIAIEQAGDKAKGSVAASDAFLPFGDTVAEFAKAGITAIIQPGGSIRDEESIKAADEAGIAMVFTGRRHFRH